MVVMNKVPLQYQFKDQHQFRIIPSVYPPINFFEDLVDPAEMELLWEIESLTNERIQQESGDIFLVPPEDRVSGHGSSVVMAAFTHIGKPSRFTDGSFGIYYTSFSKETAIRETIYHRELFFKATNEDACEIPMRVYEGKVLKPLHDIRKIEYQHLHDPSDYMVSQQFGKALRAAKSWGVVYNSVRHEGVKCIAVFRAPAISIPKQTAHLRYVWNGSRISEVLDSKSVLQLA
jgi:hypothetical protein